MNASFPEIESLLQAFERRMGVSLCVYDWTGKFRRMVPASRLMHQSLHCRAWIQRDMSRCTHCDFLNLVRSMLQTRKSGFFKHCHGNVIEYVEGLWTGDWLIGAVLAGQFRKPSGVVLPPPVLTVPLARPDAEIRQLHEQVPWLTEADVKELPLLVRTLALRLERTFAPLAGVGESDDRRKWIIEHYLTGWHSFPEASAAMLAGILKVSESRLRHIVRELYGKSFGELLVEWRLRRAQQLLATTSLTATRIFGQCGYLDRNHFHRTFRREIGVPPLEYRRQVQAGEREMPEAIFEAPREA